MLGFVVTVGILFWGGMKYIEEHDKEHQLHDEKLENRIKELEKLLALEKAKKDEETEKMLDTINKTTFEVISNHSPKITMTKIRITPIRSEHLDNPVYKALVDRHLDEVAVLMDKINNAIIYCDSRSHAELLAKTFGYPTVFGSTPKKQREQIVEQFTSGQIPFVFTFGYFPIELYHKGLENIIILTSFSAPSKAIQVISRLDNGEGDKVCFYNQNFWYPGHVIDPYLEAAIALTTNKT